jgi:alpha-tubulin suppressor-like RCC1 family protein
VEVLPTVSASQAASFAVRHDGTVLAWGDRQYGRLGDGQYLESSTRHPQNVPANGIRTVSSADHHAIALRVDGTVITWGENDSGQIGVGQAQATFAPTLVPGLNNMVSVAAGPTFSLALRGDGVVFAWGDNSAGQLGVGDQMKRYAPAQVTGLSGIRTIAAGENHALAVDMNGRAYAWGLNGFGQLGVGDWDLVLSPTPIAVVRLEHVRSIAAGNSFSLALLEDGTVQGWGLNDIGQLGVALGPSGYSSSAGPQPTGLTNVVQISAGDEHALALFADGTAAAWGEAGNGRRGDGTSGSTQGGYTRFWVDTSGSRIVSLSAGTTHSLFVLADGTVTCTGSNFWSQCGQVGLNSDHAYPFPIADDVNVLRP